MQCAGLYGSVDYTKVIFDRETKQSKGYGFVYMQTVEDAWKVHCLYF